MPASIGECVSGVPEVSSQDFRQITIKSEAQLISLVKDRTSVSRPDAERDVQSWTRDRQF